LRPIDKQGVKLKYGGGNQQECDAVTKPWKWSADEGLDDNTLAQMNGGGSESGNKPTDNKPTPAPGGCVDKTPECASRAESCPDEAMKYWCPKTCKFC